MLSRWLGGLLALSLAACANLPFPPAATPTLAPAPAASPTASIEPVTATPPTPDQLTVWLPPRFAPDVETPGGSVLAQQLAEFEQTRSLTLTVRLKAEAGRGGLLDSLLTAYNVAPGVLPDVIALNRDDLAAAAQAGVLTTLDGLLLPETLSQAYPFAQAMSRLEGRWVGAPFAAEARLAVYNTEIYATAPTQWSDVTTGTVLLPGAEGTGLAVLNDYLALDGPLTGDNGQPALSVPLLTSVLTQWSNLREARLLPLTTLGYPDTAATWEAFREGRGTMALTSANVYLAGAQRARQTAAMLPPTVRGNAFTLADGWGWALVNTGADDPRAAELVNWLTAPARLAEWTQAARVLPPRADALAAWGDDPQAPLAAAVLTNAQLQPPRATLEKLGPLLAQALDDVLNNRATPEAAARTVAQSYSQP